MLTAHRDSANTRERTCIGGNTMIQRLSGFALSIFACAAPATGTAAEQYPSKPVRVIVTQTAGSNMDVMARLLAPKLSELMGQQFVIDNRGGAGGLIGAQIAARALPDGYTLVFGGASSMINTSFTYKNIGFDPLQDFVPISMVVAQEAILTVHPSLPVKTVRDLVALAKAKPNTLNMASAGIGSSAHLAGVMFNSLAGVDTVHVAYKGGSAMLTAVVGNESQWLFALAASTAAHYKSGRLRALAVSTKQRSPVMPELPTIEEAGVAGYDFTTWNAFFAPKGMPQRYVTAVHAAIQKAITEPDIKELYAAQSLVPRGSANPEEFARFFKADFERVGKVIKLAGIKPE